LTKSTEIIVLDASVALTWCYPDEHSAFAYKVLDQLEHRRAIVPSLWAVEIANALVVGERRLRLTASAVAHFLELLGGLAIETDMQTAPRALTTTRQLARDHNLSAYDAIYLELAMREGLMLATLDTQLKSVAKSAGVKLFA
jgi:predicted nucleic acid-binding protein